jgi:hypothetical protein
MFCWRGASLVHSEPSFLLTGPVSGAAHDTLSGNLIKNGDFEAFTTKKKYEVETIRPNDASATAFPSWTVVPNPFNRVSQGDVNMVFETFFGGWLVFALLLWVF